MNSPRIFLTSDLHLGHANIIKYCNRPFDSVEQMNEELIRRWNNTVGKEDKVFFLGDFALGDRETVIRWGRQFQGRKIMIYGNHDHHKQDVYYEAGFETVSKWPIVIHNRYLLSHAPFLLQGDSPYWGPLINIHGHIHDKLEQGPTIGSQSVCVCVERWDYRPVELSVIEKEMKKNG